MTAPVIAGLLLAAAALAFALVTRLRTARTVARLDRMLQAAVDGTFREERFDETRLSSLEGRMRRYLTENAVTGRQVAQEKTRIQELLSDLSHQLKTPVANLLLYAQLLAEKPLPDDCRPLTEALTDQAEKLRFLTDALVKLSRLETGVLQLHPTAGPVAPLLERAVGQARPKAEARDMTLTVRGGEETAVYDGKWTAEALGNLLDNAVKYAPAGSEIAVSVRAYELFCRIDVTDRGPGIPEAEQSRIFRRFYRSPAVADREGVGLGLALSREIAAAQGGYLKVASRPGRGSTFSLFLPRP